MSRSGDFWARRKAAVAAEAEAETAALDAEALTEERAALEELSDEELLAQLNLPDPDTLQKGDDFKAFMAQAVPDRIRRRALRTLWRSNPVLANVDMLVDYGEDFTDSAMAVENIQTAYQVGKGMLKHVQEMARQAEEREAPSEREELTPEIEDDDVLLAADDADPVEVSTEPSSEVEVEDDTDFAVPAPRRMKFRLEESAA